MTNVNSVLHGLIIDGIFAGIGSVLSFLPIIITLFFFLSILEDTGYSARVAFFMDKLLRKIGLDNDRALYLSCGFYKVLIFIPKILAVCLCIVLLSPWIGQRMLVMTREILGQLERFIQ